MTAVLRILLFLLPISHAMRVRMIVQWQVEAYLRCLLDDDGAGFRALAPGDLARLDGMIRDTEMLLAYGVWLHARHIGGLAARRPAPWRLEGGDPRASAFSLFVRLERVARLLGRFDACARRQRARLDAPPRAAHAEPLSPRFALPQTVLPAALELSG